MTSRPPLRERRKQRTRDALIVSALDLFGSVGFDQVTLERLCDTAEVSKRTFFRTFTSKEQVAMAPYEDLWAHALGALETFPPAERPVIDVLSDSLLAGIDAMNSEGWTERLRRSVRLAVLTPAIEAHCLYFGHRTTAAAMETLRRRHGVDPAHEGPVLLAMDIVVAAHRRSITTWAARPGTADGTLLTNETRQTLAKVKHSLVTTGRP